MGPSENPWFLMVLYGMCFRGYFGSSILKKGDLWRSRVSEI
jgi:hypothetical protein